MKKDLRINILEYLTETVKDLDPEQKEVLEYLKTNELHVFPYNFVKDYKPENVQVLFDPSRRLRYVVHENRQLYFKRSRGEKEIRSGWAGLLSEQDINSPHRYLTNSFGPADGEILVDIGAAEGNFTLSVIEKARKVYIFETSRKWSEALMATFAPWSGKVEIINKYVSDTDDKDHVSLDKFFEGKEPPGFIKIDVDGAEASVMRGCKNMLRSGIPLKLALCTYHRKDDEKIFSEMLKDAGFSVNATKGYMIFYDDKDLGIPYLRRGLLQAVR
jgi:hypothetical protein